jgi:hypothetical protein
MACNSGVDLPNLAIQIGNFAGCYLNLTAMAKPRTKVMSARRHTRILCVERSDECDV